ncbi:MAG TPA: hypothetical protein VFD49_14805 [Candidatus Dormibacteraeota bacterium]|nr:hypothetical protein [Candidatus Dormibacteraeota bacterium]
MVTLHRELVASLGGDPTAVLVETPYGFQENADEVTAKARRYFAVNVGLQVRVAPGLRRPADTEAVDLAQGIAAVRAADWVFTGPGSPSYAARQWSASPVGAALRDRLRRGGITVVSSAAACTLGRFTLPVYEIYKVGMDPAWLEGIDLMAELGLVAAVIPHFDNREGGTHDTRYCFVGERRLRALEAQLPGEAVILGIDEHTAAVFDLGTGTLSVRGHGGVTLRRAGSSHSLGPGTVLTLDELCRLAAGQLGAPAAPVAPATAAPVEAEGRRDSLRMTAQACEERFDRAEAALDARAMAAAALDLEEAIAAWSDDVLESDELGQARTVLRSLIVRLGAAAVEGMSDPHQRLAPVVEPVLALRARLREQGEYRLADALRDALGEGGVEVRDRRDGTTWLVRESRSRPGRPGTEP